MLPLRGQLERAGTLTHREIGSLSRVVSGASRKTKHLHGDDPAHDL
jgi:hypothetical protein